MRTIGIRVGPLDTNCWVVSDDVGGPVAVIDPGDDVDAVIEAVGDRDIAIVILTHAHFDHVGATAALLERRPAPVAIHEDDAAFMTTAEGTGGALFGYAAHVAPPADVTVKDGDRLHAGRVEFEVMHTPGHTPGGICLLAGDGTGGQELFSGDTLFAGSVGRTDFPRGSARSLAESIARKLAPLPHEVIVHPGHGPDTTIGREARLNPFWPRA